MPQPDGTTETIASWRATSTLAAKPFNADWAIPAGTFLLIQAFKLDKLGKPRFRLLVWTGPARPGDAQKLACSVDCGSEDEQRANITAVLEAMAPDVLQKPQS